MYQSQLSCRALLSTAIHSCARCQRRAPQTRVGIAAQGVNTAHQLCAAASQLTRQHWAGCAQVSAPLLFPCHSLPCTHLISPPTAAAGMCVQVLDTDDYKGYTRLRITWKGATGGRTSASSGRRREQEMWVTQITPSGCVLLADVDQRDWVNVEEATKLHWANVIHRPDGLLPMNDYARAHQCVPRSMALCICHYPDSRAITSFIRGSSYSPPPAAGGAVTPTATAPTHLKILEKDTLLDGPVPSPLKHSLAHSFDGPHWNFVLSHRPLAQVVGVEWSSGGTIAPLDWEVQWGYRWSGGWFTARPYRLETMLEGARPAPSAYSDFSVSQFSSQTDSVTSLLM